MAAIRRNVPLFPCPKCQQQVAGWDVVIARSVYGAISRTRRCEKCGSTFRTLEYVSGAKNAADLRNIARLAEMIVEAGVSLRDAVRQSIGFSPAPRPKRKKAA